ncbi:protein-serine/threonine phosphatase [Betaproteobacteria bacterium]|nr:protein-serine/threonine phosphatase [Betaproteobacteria bacterium]GHU03935.1 protein-serine/threonine phosphatase [Betaproteobacteria bacterium]GHU13803.1 protein-serine/threonine phosphatase [Betaproteobacteria bacterium]GHU24873.1 protein-serine/threonine phosphatase [Betaproteobacteria bacterium]
MAKEDEVWGGAVLECASQSHVGMVRARNEDALWVDAERGWLLLADGMGGHHAGDVASSLAVSNVLNSLQQVDQRTLCEQLVAGFADANAAIRCAALRETITGVPGGEIMGSTFVGALLTPQEIVYAHIGDSRLYLLRGDYLSRLTRDHTLVQEYVEGGLLTPELAQNHPYRGLLTRGLGVDDLIEPETGTQQLQPGDRLLLCSDGLTDMVNEEIIASLLGAALPAAEIVQNLIDAANAHGGRDNVSVIVAWFVGEAHHSD